MKTIDSLGFGSTKASRPDIIPPRGTNSQGSIGQWRWHYRALVKLRERLLKHRAELAAAVVEAIATSDDSADAASDEFEHDLTLSRLSAEQDVLYEVQAALERIRAGTYGICEATGQPIPAARLRAIPWTRFRLEVEQNLESEGILRPPHLGQLKSVGRAKARRLSSPSAEVPATDETLVEVRSPRPLPRDFAGARLVRRTTHLQTPVNGKETL